MRKGVCKAKVCRNAKVRLGAQYAGNYSHLIIKAQVSVGHSIDQPRLIPEKWVVQYTHA